MTYIGVHRSPEPRVIALLGKGFLTVTAIGVILLAPLMYVSICILTQGADTLRTPNPSPLPTATVPHQEARK